MDTTQTIILTSIVNIILTGLVGGIVIYVVQKRIESSFTKKLEEFKASLAYSNFEQQTRFVSAHTKRIETLQVLYKKLVLYSESYVELIWQTNRCYNSLQKTNSTPSDYERIFEKLIDFHMFHIENHLFLPDDVAKEIDLLYSNVESLHEMAYWNLPTRKDWNIDRDTTEALKYQYQESFSSAVTSKYSKQEWEEADYSDIHVLLMDTMKNQVKTLEDLYNAVAEAKQIEKGC